MKHPYTTMAYAQSLAHWGEALSVPEWDGTVIIRPIDDARSDAFSPYPIAVLPPDADLAGGLDRLRKAGLVSVTLVLDDHHRPQLERLQQHFDLVRPFKTHFIIDREKGDIAPTKHHRYEIKRALAEVDVRIFSLAEHMGQWQALYNNLVLRHGLSGLHAFPERHFESLAAIPGFTAIGAFRDDRLVSAHIWAMADAYAHSHLAASSEEGMRFRAAYAVNAMAAEFMPGARVINFGGGAGLLDKGEDGLAKFKQGFSNQTWRAYICGKVLDTQSYAGLTQGRARTEYFPAYRMQ